MIKECSIQDVADDVMDDINRKLYDNANCGIRYGEAVSALMILCPDNKLCEIEAACRNAIKKFGERNDTMD